MKQKISYLLILMVMLVCLPISAQRRSRPGAMKHSQTETNSQMKETPVNATYVRNGSYFEGPVYYTDGASNRGIKTGDAGLMFLQGKYLFSFNSAKFKTRSVGHYLWDYEKITPDFDYSGNYKVIKQYGQITLILYDGDSNNVFARIPLSSLATKEIEFSNDEILIKLSLKRKQ